MLIKSLSFMNYKKYKEPTEISLEDFAGRIGILGNNGSGKSSLLDVITISLFGVDAVTGKKEHLRTQGVDKDMVKLRFEFKHTGRDFIIEREFKGVNLTPKANLFELIDDAVALLATSAKDVTKYVEKLLNMNYATFVSTIFCKQKELDKLSGMDPADKKRFILKLSGVDRIEDEIKKCRELKRESDKYVSILMDDVTLKDDILKEIELLNVEIKNIKNEHKGALKKLETAKLNFKNAEATKKELDLKYEKFNELCIKGNEAKSNISYLEKEVAKLTTERDEILRLRDYMNQEGQSLIDKHKYIEKKLEELDNQRVLYAKKQQLIESIDKIKSDGLKLKEEVSRLLEKGNSLNFNKEDLSKLEEKKSKLTDEIDSLKNQNLSLSSEAKIIENKANECKIEIEKIKSLHNSESDESCSCPMCKQTVSKEYIQIVEKHYLNEISVYRNSYSELAKNISSVKEQIESKTKELQDLKLQESELRKLERDYNDILAQYNAAKQQHTNKINEYKINIKNLEEYSNVSFDEKMYNDTKVEKSQYDEKLKKVYIAADKIKQLDKVEDSLKAATKNLSSQQEVYNGLLGEFNSLNFDKASYQKHKDLFDKAYEKYTNISQETNELNNKIATKDVTERKFLNDKLDVANKKEKDYNKHLNLSKDYATIEATLIKTKEHIMSQINPLINKHLSSIFKTLMNEKYDDIELDEQYNLCIYDCGEAFPLSRFSGGEQDLSNLALRLAISKFLAEVNSGSIEFIVLDEIFASLDDERKSALIDVLGNLRDFFKQIFIISHEDVIKSSLDHYLIVKENEYRYSEIEY